MVAVSALSHVQPAKVCCRLSEGAIGEMTLGSEKRPFLICRASSNRNRRRHACITKKYQFDGYVQYRRGLERVYHHRYLPSPTLELQRALMGTRDVRGLCWICELAKRSVDNLRAKADKVGVSEKTSKPTKVDCPKVAESNFLHCRETT